MPNLLKKGASSRTVKNEEKKTFAGLFQQQPNRLDNYVIKPPAAAGTLANNTGPNNQRIAGNNPPPERFHSNRLMGQDKQFHFPSVDVNRKLMGLPQPGAATLMFKELDSGRHKLSNAATMASSSTMSISGSDSISGCFRPRRRPNNSDDSSEEESITFKKMDIIDYYKARGMDYFEERKKCRQYISRRPSEFSPLTDNEKLTGGAVFWDEYSPPPGYTWQDLEGIPIPEDPIPESPKGNQISPCVLKAANLRFKQETPISSSPIPSSQNFRDIIEQLESIQTNREKFMEERRKKKEQKLKQKQAMIENDDDNQSINMEVSGAENLVPAERSVGNEYEFPTNDEDSFLQRATQLEELVVVADNPCRDGNLDVHRATVNNSRILSPAMGGNTPVTSGSRLLFRNKSKRRSNLKRPSSGRLDFSNELSGSPVKKSSTTTSPDSEESFSFEKSEVEIKTAEIPKEVIGDFVEDDDDDVFSQMPMPEVPKREPNSEKTVPVNEKSTELVSGNSSIASEFEGDSITDDMLGEIDQLEALARATATGGQSKANVYTSTPLQNPNSMASPSPALGIGLRKSVRISTNNLSAIKMDTPTNTLNESNEKPPSKSRLSRSYIRARK